MKIIPLDLHTEPHARTDTHTRAKAGQSEGHRQSRSSQMSETSTYLQNIAGVSEVSEGAE